MTTSHGYFRVITILLTFILHVTNTSPIANALESSSYNPRKPHGQTRLNHLRDAVSVSNFGHVFGRRGSALLSKKVVSPEQVWETVDELTRTFLSDPEQLDWIVADVAADNEDSVSINYAFSCLDLGMSKALRLVWWVDTELRILNDTQDEVGGAVRGSSQPNTGETNTDLIMQCWYSKRPKRELHFFEHRDLHEGSRNMLLSDLNLTAFVDDQGFFRRIKEQRQNYSEQEEVIYDPNSGVPITIGLPFTTGFRVIVPAMDENSELPVYKVPATPLFAVRSHMEARLSGAVSYPLESTTTSIQVVLSVLSTGLAVILAVWIVVKLAADAAKYKLSILRKLGVRAVVQGRYAEFNRDRMQIIHQIIGVTILAAPFTFAIINGEADPSRSVIVTTGATIFYGEAKEQMSLDPKNKHAGSPFIITGWLSVTKLDNGHYIAFALSVAFVLLSSCYVALREGKRWSETMPYAIKQYPGFSFWKAYGAFRLWLKSFQNEDDRDVKYRVLVEFIDSCGTDSSEIEPLLVAAPEYRELIKKCKSKKCDGKNWMTKRTAGASDLCEALEQESNRTFQLCANVVMNNRYRFEAMMTGSRWWYNRLPREFYFLTSQQGPLAKSIEWFRTNGRFLSDELLVPVRMGLLPYLDRVKRISICVGDSPDVRLDDDGVNINIISRNNVRGSFAGSTSPDRWPIVRQLHAGDDQSSILTPDTFFAKICS